MRRILERNTGIPRGRAVCEEEAAAQGERRKRIGKLEFLVVTHNDKDVITGVYKDGRLYGRKNWGKPMTFEHDGKTVACVFYDGGSLLCFCSSGVIMESSVVYSTYGTNDELLMIERFGDGDNSSYNLANYDGELFLKKWPWVPPVARQITPGLLVFGSAWESAIVDKDYRLIANGVLISEIAFKESAIVMSRRTKKYNVILDDGTFLLDEWASSISSVAVRVKDEETRYFVMNYASGCIIARFDLDEKKIVRMTAARYGAKIERVHDDIILMDWNNMQNVIDADDGELFPEYMEKILYVKKFNFRSNRSSVEFKNTVILAYVKKQILYGDEG